MKRFLLICACLIVWTIVWMAGYDYLNLVLMRGASANPAAKIERLFSADADEKIAIFGSSRALGNYYPSQIGTDVYDYGMNGMGMAEALFLCQEYLKRHHPDMIIIDLNPWEFGDLKTVKYVGDYRLVGHSSRVRAILPQGLLKCSDWVPGLRFQGGLRRALAQYINAKKCATKKIDCGAEILLNSRTEAEWRTLDRTLYDYAFNFRKESVRILDDLYAIRGRTKIAWVVSPLTPEMSIRMKDVSKLESFLSEQTKKPGIYARSYLDQTPYFPREYFVDNQHLNIRGASRFSEMLKDWLSELR